MDGSTAGYAQRHPTPRSHELFIYGLLQQLVPAEADTEYAEEELFLMKFQFLTSLEHSKHLPEAQPSLQEVSYGMVLCASLASGFSALALLLSSMWFLVLWDSFWDVI